MSQEMILRHQWMDPAAQALTPATYREAMRLRTRPLGDDWMPLRTRVVSED